MKREIAYTSTGFYIAKVFHNLQWFRWDIDIPALFCSNLSHEVEGLILSFLSPVSGSK